MGKSTVGAFWSLPFSLSPYWSLLRPNNGKEKMHAFTSAYIQLHRSLDSGVEKTSFTNIKMTIPPFTMTNDKQITRVLKLEAFASRHIFCLLKTFRHSSLWLQELTETLERKLQPAKGHDFSIAKKVGLRKYSVRMIRTHKSEQCVSLDLCRNISMTT